MIALDSATVGQLREAVVNIERAMMHADARRRPLLYLLQQRIGEGARDEDGYSDFATHSVGQGQGRLA